MTDRQPSDSDQAPDSAPSSVTNRQGGVDINAQRDVVISGDLVARDKIINRTRIIHERVLTAAEEARQANSIEKEYLAHGVDRVVQSLQARAQSTNTTTGGPYRGLLAYDLGDAEIFFGRERAIRDVLQHLARGALLVLHAESGAGKTSLLQAGIAPRLIGAGHLPLRVRAYDQNPVDVIKREFLPNLDQAPRLKATSLRDFLRQVGEVLGAAATLYLILDQFEEFFTQLDEPLRADFVKQLADCLDDPSLNVRWVLSLRAEYFSSLASFRPRIRNPFENDCYLKALTREEARDVVAQPGAQQGVNFEADLIDRVLDDLGKNEIAPPQLQIVCEALFDALPAGETTITVALYDHAGGAAGILRDYLEQVLSRDLRPEQRTAARQLLESLITSEQQRVLRTHAQLVAELTARGVTPQTLDVILTQLIDSHLISAEETDEGIVYELAHDYLLGEIKLDPAVQARKAAQELLEQELRAHRRYGALLSADRLKVIDQYRAELLITPEAAALIDKSRAAVQHERFERRRIRLLLGASVAAIVVILLIIGPVRALYDQTYRIALRDEAQQLGKLIPLDGGTFTFGTTATPPDRFEATATLAAVAPFAIERTEVTNHQYRLCLEAGGCKTPPTDQKFFSDPQFADHPVVFVKIKQAAEYCAWLDRRLPTEQEWEFAARGTSDRPWPWASAGGPTPDRANLFITDPMPAQTVPADSLPNGATPEGVLQLAGNVWEWTTGTLQVNQAAQRYDRGPVWNGIDFATLAVRGGDYQSKLERITAAVPADVETSYDKLGFRCAQ
jgi:formylglycine-generating enzyme required for sulfatase activity